MHSGRMSQDGGALVLNWREAKAVDGQLTHDGSTQAPNRIRSIATIWSLGEGYKIHMETTRNGRGASFISASSAGRRTSV